MASGRNIDKEVTENGLTAFRKTEITFLRKLKAMGGMTVAEALEDKIFEPASGWDAVDALQKFSDLGFLDYQPDTGKFIPSASITPEIPANSTT